MKVSKFGIIKEFFEFLWQNKIWWIAPIVIVMLLVGALIIVTGGSSPLLPFIYTLF